MVTPGMFMDLPHTRKEKKRGRGVGVGYRGVGVGWGELARLPDYHLSIQPRQLSLAPSPEPCTQE